MKIGLLYETIGHGNFKGSVVRLMNYVVDDMFPCKIQYVEAYHRGIRNKSLDGNNDGFREENLKLLMKMNRNGANS